MHDTDVAPGRPDADECLPYYFGHLADTERVFEYRALRIARADPVMWTAVEFPNYAAAANFQARSLGDVVAGHERHHLASIRRQHGR